MTPEDTLRLLKVLIDRREWDEDNRRWVVAYDPLIALLLENRPMPGLGEAFVHEGQHTDCVVCAAIGGDIEARTSLMYDARLHMEQQDG